MASLCSSSSFYPYFLFFCSRVLERSTMVILEFASGAIQTKRPWLGLHYVVIKAWIQRAVQNYIHQLGVVLLFSFLSFPEKLRNWFSFDFCSFVYFLWAFELILYVPLIFLSFCWIWSWFGHSLSFRVSQGYYLDGSKFDEWKSLESCVWGRHGTVLTICFRKKLTGWKREVILSMHKLFEHEMAKNRWHTGASVVWWN